MTGLFKHSTETNPLRRFEHALRHVRIACDLMLAEVSQSAAPSDPRETAPKQAHAAAKLLIKLGQAEREIKDLLGREEVDDASEA